MHDKPTRMEASMTQHSKGQQPKPGQVHPVPADDPNKQKQQNKAQAEEIAGRHKNSGQKDHKGAR